MDLKHYVTLDGDTYMMTYPFLFQMVEIENYLKEHRIRGARKEILLDTCLVIKPTENEKQPYRILSYARNGLTAPKDLRPGSWRPMLIPVKRGTMEYDDWFGKTKNGNLVTGYSLYIGKNGGQAMTVPRSPVEKPRYPGDSYRYTFEMEVNPGDTDEDPEKQLSWIVWNGTLVCTKVLLKGIPDSET